MKRALIAIEWILARDWQLMAFCVGGMAAVLAFGVVP
jgi:hypothetical protein